MKDLKYTLIGSSSKGNSVVIENILIDIGLPFKHIAPYLTDIKYLFITHKHVDHLKLSTFKAIKQKYKHIEIYTNYEVAQVVGVENVTKILGFDYDYGIGNMIVTPFEAIHDVVCSGYVFKFDNLNIIYTTDNCDMKNAPKLKYDYLFIESNHDEKIVEQYMNSAKFGYDVYKNAKRHLSTQQCKEFYYLNRRSKDSKLIELHKSNRFY